MLLIAMLSASAHSEIKIAKEAKKAKEEKQRSCEARVLLKQVLSAEAKKHFSPLEAVEATAQIQTSVL